MTSRKPLTVTLNKGKVCKGVVRYEGGTTDDPFTNVYVDKDALKKLGDPDKLTFTVAPGAGSPTATESG